MTFTYVSQRRITSSRRHHRKQFSIPTVCWYSASTWDSQYIMLSAIPEDSIVFNLKNSIISCFPGGKCFLETFTCGVYDVSLYHSVLRKNNISTSAVSNLSVKEIIRTWTKPTSNYWNNSDFFFSWLDSPSGPWPPRWGFEITLRHTTLGRTRLDKS